MSLGPADGKLSLRQYLLFRTLEASGEAVNMSDYMVAVEAVSSTALAHPEWDLDARQEWAEWDKWAAREDVAIGAER